MRAARLLPLLAVTTALDRCVEWATVCAPPGCDGNATLVELARRRASAAGRRWTVLGAAARITNADAKTRSEKLRLVRDWIRRDGPRCDFVIFADATDVVAGAGADETIRDAVRTLTRGDAAALVVAGEAACYVGKPCSTREAEALVARAAAAPGGQPFPNSGLYAGSVEAVAAFVDFAVATERKPWRCNLLQKQSSPTLQRLSIMVSVARGYSAETGRGAAAAATRISRGDGPQHRRGRHADIP